MLDALKVSLAVVEALRGPVAVLRAADPDLCRQVKRAGSSLALNVAEGSRRVGRDRKHSFRVAAGSAAEVRVALQTAIAWGDLDAPAAEPALGLLDRVLAMPWRLAH